jgi:deoxyribodipyrimidine photo-lyase
MKLVMFTELRAQFIMESVADLRDSLRQRGLDLVVRQGKPEDIVPSIAKSIGAHTVMSLHHHSCKLQFVKVELDHGC